MAHNMTLHDPADSVLENTIQKKIQIQQVYITIKGCKWEI